MTEPAPEPLDRQRIAIFEEPTGAWVIARAGPICETCAGCGCGDPLDPITINPLFVRMIKARAEGRMPKLTDMRQLAGMMGGAFGGKDGTGSGPAS